MKRGDIVTAAPGGPLGRKPRPYIVIQADDFVTPLVLLIGLTTADGEPYDIRPRIEPSAMNGLRETSDAMVDAMIATRRSKIGQVTGSLGEDELTDIEVAVVRLLGLTG